MTDELTFAKRKEDLAFLASFYKLTGVRINLRKNECVHTAQSTDNQILLSIVHYEVRDLVRETRYVKRLWTVYTIKRADENSRWQICDMSEIEDSSFVPYAIRHFGRVETAQEVQERRSFEDLCYRPGTDRHPLESLAVTEERVMDSDATKKMRRHWNV